MKTIRTEFEALVTVLDKYDLFVKDDEVFNAITSLEAIITETEKRIVCANKIAEGIGEVIRTYTKGVDNETPNKELTLADHDAILCGSYDVVNALDMADDMCVEDNWFKLFKTEEVEKSNGGIPYRICAKCGIKEEETVMTNTNEGGWLCCDCNPPTALCQTPTALCQTPQTHEFVKEIIAKLKVIDVDGETMQYILEQVGMDDQMLRQLVMSRPIDETKGLLDEKIEIQGAN